MFAGNDVIAISSLGVLQVVSDYGFCKGNADFIFMVNWYFLSILNGLHVIQLFVFGWDFLTGSEMFGKITPKTSIERKHLLGGHLLTPNCVFLDLVCEIISISVWPVQVRKKEGRKAGRQEGRLAGRQEGRKKSHKKSIFHVCLERPIIHSCIQ